jgi:hypothetical protein
LPTFLQFYPFCLWHRTASGRGSQNKKMLFWGDRNGRGRTEGARAKQKLRRCRAPQKPRNSAGTNRQGMECDRKRVIILLVAVVVGLRNPNHRQFTRLYRKSTSAVRRGSRNPGQETGHPAYSAKTRRRRYASASETQLRSPPGKNRITTAKSAPKSRSNVCVTNCSVHAELSDFRH